MILRVLISRTLRCAALLVPALLVLNACAPVVLMNASIEQDRYAKTFSPPADKSLIYIYLEEPTLNVTKHVVIDGRIAGISRPSTYLMTNVPPGRHRVGLGHTDENSIWIDTDQGKNYFVKAHVSCEEGKTRALLEMADEATGRQQILASSLANITLFGRPLLNESVTRSCGTHLGNS